jgi:hypothetical protein
MVAMNRIYSHKEILAIMMMLTIVLLFLMKVGLFFIKELMIMLAIIFLH